MNEEEKDIKERVLEITTRNFTISGCPEEVFQRFISYAKKQTANGYWMALKQLLDISDTNAKDMLLFERIMALEDRVSELEEGNRTKKKKRTFGMKKTEVNKDE